MPYRMTPSVRHRAIEVHYYYYYYYYYYYKFNFIGTGNINNFIEENFQHCLKALLIKLKLFIIS